MEYGKKAKDTVAYNYGNERLSYEDAKNKNKADTFIYNYDGRGRVSNVLDDNGTSMVQYSYDAFGETTISGKQAKKTANTYQFNGESTDKVTGLQYLRARYYDSTTGRFTSEDTYSGDMSDPLTLNKYLYTNNDPVNYIDPTGHFLDEIWNAVKEIGSATIKTAGDIGNAVWNIWKDPTPQNAIKQTIGLAINANNNYSNAVNRIKGYSSFNPIGTINTNNNVSVGKGINSNVKAGPAIPINVTKPKSSYNRQVSAAVNSKVEQSRQIENQIRLLRQQGTPDANSMADYLQANMKKLCESSLAKINEQDLKVYDSRTWFEKFRDTGNEAIEQTGNFLIGMGTSLVSGFIGGNLSIGYGIGTVIKQQGNFFDGMTEFNQQYTNPVVNSVKDNIATRNDTFDVGYAVGTVIPLAAGIYGVVNSAGSIVQVSTNIISQFGNVAAQVPAIALNGEAAIQLIGNLGLTLFAGNNLNNEVNSDTNRKSTGRTEANDLKEQLAMEQVKSDPLNGAKELPIELGDDRWSASDGWVKMQNIVKNSDGTQTVIHFNYNKITGGVADFKFK